MKWTICGLETSGEMATIRQIHRIQEAGWSERQLRSSLSGAAASVRIAVELTQEVRAKARPVLGFVLARRVADVLEIDLIGVVGSRRRLGIGRSLLAALIADESRSGLGETRLELASSNDAARALYRGFGFVVVGLRKRYYPDGDDALLLSRQNGSAQGQPG